MFIKSLFIVSKQVSAVYFFAAVCMLLSTSFGAADDYADASKAVRESLKTFTAEGTFEVFYQEEETASEGVTWNGAFKWICDEPRFFCEIHLNPGPRMDFERATVVRDFERIAVCVFSPAMSRGCMVKVYAFDNAAYRVGIQLFPFDLRRGSDVFWPNSVYSKFSDYSFTGIPPVATYVTDAPSDALPTLTSELLLRPEFSYLMTSLRSFAGSRLFAEHAWSFDRTEDGAIIPKEVVYRTNSPGEFAKENVVRFQSFVVDAGDCDFSFSLLDACDNAMFVDQSSPEIKHVQVAKEARDDVTIAESVQRSLEIAAERNTQTAVPVKSESSLRIVLATISGLLFAVLAIVLFVRKA